MPEIINTEFTPYMSLLGGVLIGLSAFLLYLTIGKIAGISGVIKGVLYESKAWRYIYVLGILVGAYICQLYIQDINLRVSYPANMTIISGLLVGFGAVYGSGCTSGHGVCGIARLSKRSIVATFIFCIAAILTVTIMQIV
jgi:uncharacterized protein